MKIAYFDCFSGISGDMILGALVDAGLDPALLLAELDKLNLDHVNVSFESTSRKAIVATHARVEALEVFDGHPRHQQPQGRAHAAVSDTADSHLVLHPPNASSKILPHRHLNDILQILHNSGLHPADSGAATDIFRRLAQAEAQVHGVTDDDVILHEVGAVDAIIDIVGAVAGLRLLEVDEVHASPLRCGTGFVACAHGRYPVPVPGVLALCENVPLVQSDVEAELITPTGAAIITTLAKGFGNPPSFRQTAVGYGAGNRDLDQHPNLLRVRLGETGPLNGNGAPAPDTSEIAWAGVLADAATPPRDSDQVVQLEANIDDMNPEVYGYVIDLLLEKGARDVYLTPIHMKKGRPGTLLTALTDAHSMEAVCETILAETTTLGVRYSIKNRRLLPRRLTTASTEYGEVRVKTTTTGTRSRFAPEYDDCARLARQKGIPILAVYEAALAAVEKDSK